MSIWRQLSRGFRALVRRASVDAELTDEIRHYFEQSVADHTARGLTPEAARRAAQIEIGNATVAHEQVRSYGWENTVSSVMADARYAARRLRAAPAFTTVAVLTLALGIGASTAIFSAIYPILLEPLPYPHARELVTLQDRLDDGTPFPLAFGSLREIEARSTTLASAAAAAAWSPTLTGRERPVRLSAQRVTANYFATLRVAPAIGHDFDSSDDIPGGRRTIILGDALWRREFGADSAILGRTVKLDENAYVVVGVMPPSFESVPGSPAEAWSLLQLARSLPSEGPEWGHFPRVVARLRPGVSIDRAHADIDAIARHPVPDFIRPPWAKLSRGISMQALRADATHSVSRALFAVLAAAALLLIIVCVNVANLLLARGAQRRGELALRATLGAERSRLIRQLLTESLLLSLMGGGGGVLIARFGVRMLKAVAPAGLPRVEAIGIDGPVLVFALAVSACIGIAIGLAPAFQAGRQDLRSGFQAMTQRIAGGSPVARRTLVIAEVALAFVLLVGTGLLVRSSRRLFAVDPGFTAGQVLTMRVNITGDRYREDSAAYRYFLRVVDAVRQVPGVVTAAATSQLPLSGDNEVYGVHFESSPLGHDAGSVVRYAVTTAYFKTMGITLVRGRAFQPTDNGTAPHVVVLNQTFARRAFAGRDPIGEHLHIGPDRGPWYTVVGVVADVRQQSLAGEVAEAVYIPTEQSWFADREMSLVAQVRSQPASMAPSIKAAIWSVDDHQAIVRVAPMTEVVNASAADRRFALIVFECFAIAALVLAAVGLYGVQSGSVTERVREIGVRSALGASSNEIIGLIVRQGMALTVIGLAIGLLAGIGAGRLMTSLLFDVSPADPLTYVAVTTLLAVTSLIACLIPAGRAAAVDPNITLRSE